MSKKFEEETCMTADCLISFLGQKWMIQLVYLFREHKMLRYNQIMKMLEMSPKTLSERLKGLTEMGLVTKKIFQEIPPHVEYTITDKGMELTKIFNTIEDWALNYNHKIIKTEIPNE